MRYGRVKRTEIEDWLTCNFLVRRNAFLKVKGFDSRYWGGEDTQLCYVLTRDGKKIIIDCVMGASGRQMLLLDISGLDCFNYNE